MVIFAFDLTNPLSLLTGNKSDTALKLLHNVDDIAATGDTGTLFVYGTNAEIIISAPSSKDNPRIEAPIMAAGTIGKGRVVALSNAGFMDIGAFKDNDTFPMLANCAEWCAGAKGGDSLKVAIHDNEELADMFSGRGVTTINITDADWPAKAEEADVIICKADFDLKAAGIIGKHVASGKGLICAIAGQAWLGGIPGRSMRDMPANILLGQAGIAFAGNSLPAPKEGRFNAAVKGSPLMHASIAIAALEKVINEGSETNQSIASATLGIIGNAVTMSRQINSEDSQQIIKAVSLIYDCAPAQSALPYKQNIVDIAQKAATTRKTVSPDNPVKADSVNERCVIAIRNLTNKSTPVANIRPNQFAAQFPGSMPATAVRIAKDVAMNTGVPGWHSTGLYAAPGSRVAITVPDEGAGMRLSAQIGCHTDDLWDCQEWHRMPSVTRRFVLSSGTNIVANEFGGLIYIDIPRETVKAGIIKFNISGAYKAPYFRLGIDTAETWKTIRSYPAPWAELASAKLIITVPSSVVRRLDDPEQVLRFWDSALDSVRELSAETKASKYPERIVHDIQPGPVQSRYCYPIFMPNSSSSELFDLVKLRESGSWRYFHKLARNHQDDAWVLDGTGDGAGSIFCLYIFDKLCKGTYPAANELLTPEALSDRKDKYIKDGASFDKWKSEPSTAMIMYLQLKEAFGWPTYKKVFADYRKLEDDRKPVSYDDKRDEWFTRFSTASGKNLAKFFEYWGIPVSDAAKEKVKDLPSWMPADK